MGTPPWYCCSAVLAGTTPRPSLSGQAPTSRNGAPVAVLAGTPPRPSLSASPASGPPRAALSSFGGDYSPPFVERGLRPHGLVGSIGFGGDYSPPFVERGVPYAPPARNPRFGGDYSPPFVERHTPNGGGHVPPMRVLAGTTPRPSLSGGRPVRLACCGMEVLAGTTPRPSLSEHRCGLVDDVVVAVLAGTTPRPSLSGLSDSTSSGGQTWFWRGLLPALR